MLSTSILSAFATAAALFILSPTTTNAAPIVLQHGEDPRIDVLVLVSDAQNPPTASHAGTYGCTIEQIHFIDHTFREGAWLAHAAMIALGSGSDPTYRTYLGTSPVVDNQVFFGRFARSFQPPLVPVRHINPGDFKVNTVMYQCPPFQNPNSPSAIAQVAEKLTPGATAHVHGTTTYLYPIFFQHLTQTTFQFSNQVSRWQHGQEILPTASSIALHERVHCWATLRNHKVNGHMAADSRHAESTGQAPANRARECSQLLDNVKARNPSNYGYYAEQKLIEAVHSGHHAMPPAYTLPSQAHLAAIRARVRS